MMTQNEDKQAAAGATSRLTLSCVERAMREAMNAHIVVIGDVMLDEFVTGSVDRICPEAPVQVLSVSKCENYLGGAGNVANNLAPYAKRVTLIGVTGQDAARDSLVELVENIGCESGGLIADASRRTTTKTRFVSQGSQLLRCDREDKGLPSSETLTSALAALETALQDGACAVVAADYDKGVLCPEAFVRVAELCKKHGVPLLVDPKRADLATYRGATLIKPNQKESEASAQFPIDSQADAERAGRLFLEQSEANAILMTLGPRGMLLCERDASHGASYVAIPTEAREVFDVTGAGDTTMAFVALGLAGGLSYGQAAAMATAAAGISIAKRGTARVEPFEILRFFHDREPAAVSSPKLLAAEDAARMAEEARRGGHKVVFTNGCFDLIHAGHIELLRRARSHGDLLVVGLNGDESVARLKGNGRPYLKAADRAGILSAFEFVDYIAIFEEDEPIDLLERLRPDVLVKGGNYAPGEVVGGNLVDQWGGRVELIPLEVENSIIKLSRDIHRKLSDESGD